ncbi:MAG: DUF349 domain-containing protein [Cyclobacteriaceae bacterium]|jgi:hypothetical protein|nr:DUF349 domain-containing protein [Cyclobacteriaceae bacterium]
MRDENNQPENVEEDVRLAPAMAEQAKTDEVSDHDTEEEDVRPVDFSAFSKADFVALVKELSAETQFKRSDTLLKEAKPLFDEIRNQERAAALQRFKDSGGIEEDFDYRGDELDHSFDAYVKLIRDKRTQHYRQLEEQRNENLRKKNELLEKLRALVDSDDTENGFHEFKKIQDAWRQIGMVPPAQNKTLWANYHALVDRFYDHRNIYFELKELDRKRNLEAKTELCVRAEKLVQMEHIRDAVRELNELHNEFKHIGPVPLEEKEKLWQRFKQASDAVYEKRDQLNEVMQQELAANAEAKVRLLEQIMPFADFATDRIKEWNQKTQEIVAIQKQWESIGAIPRNKAKDINKKFWSAFKAYFAKKNQFFKKLDGERAHNLELKTALVKRAHELKDSAQRDRAGEELKALQQQWREIGPVPEKLRDKIYKEFKDACDHFFQHQRELAGQENKNQEENLRLKEAICAALEEAVQSKTGSLERLDELRAQFSAIGFVPRHAMPLIKARFHKAIEDYINALDSISAEEKEQAKLEVQISGLRNDPMGDKKIHHKEQVIRKKIGKLENDIATLKNNKEFFGRSRNADKFKDDIQRQINEASEQLAQLKKQLKMLQTA